MKYTKQQRLDIGGQIYKGQLTRYEAAEKYGISPFTAREYMRQYRDANHLLPKKASRAMSLDHIQKSAGTQPSGLGDLEAMDKKQLIMELVKSRIREERLKKGYEVKGDGSIITYGNKNTR